MKTCTKCGETKHLDDFYNAKQAKDGKTSACKSCLYKPCDRVRSSERMARLRQTDPIAVLLAGARARAKRDNIPFDITSKDIKKPVRCPVFGLRLIYDGTGRGYGAKDDAASLDRIHPEKGYVRGNVLVVSWKANRAKCRLTPKELLRMAAFYAKILGYSDTL